MMSRASRNLIGILSLAVFMGTAVPATAQDSSGEARIRKLEGEIRALQRKVFPGSDGKFFQPQIAPSASNTTNASAPSTSAVTDILARLDAMESQIASLTAQSEITTNMLNNLTMRMNAVDGGSAGASGGETVPTYTAPTASAPVTTAAPVTASTPVSASATVTGPTAERLAAVSKIAKPKTDDAGDDEYSYGYRLWSAGYYPEAQQQLTLFVENNPSHWRTTYGRNLLGRAYLDDNKPNEAASWFLKNYKSDKTGARAADSLLYLAESMIALNDTTRACIALAEFGDTYPAVASGRLSSKYKTGLGKVKCN